MFKRKFMTLEKDISCESALQKFKTSHNHLAIVHDKTMKEKLAMEATIRENSSVFINNLPTCIGIVTLEDIIEEILQDEIEDENDDEGKDVRMIRKQIVDANEKRTADHNLGKNQIVAISEFLHKFVGPFAHLESKQIELLVRNSEIIFINKFEDQIVK